MNFEDILKSLDLNDIVKTLGTTLLVVFAVIVEDNPVLATQGLPVLWQATQNVGLVETS